MLGSSKIKAMALSRSEKLDLFYSVCSGGDILDADVSGKAMVPGRMSFLKHSDFMIQAIRPWASRALTSWPKSIRASVS